MSLPPALLERLKKRGIIKTDDDQPPQKKQHADGEFKFEFELN